MNRVRQVSAAVQWQEGSVCSLGVDKGAKEKVQWHRNEGRK